MAHDPARSALTEAASRWAAASDEAWADFAGAFDERELGQDDHLVLAGDPLPDVVFVVAGLLRLYYTDRNGNEWNKAFAVGGGFTGSLASGLLGVPAPFSIQALEPTAVLAARWDTLEALYDRHPALERLGRRVAEQVAVKKEMKERAFLEQTATERYQAFVRGESGLAARLPLYHVASYVGVTEVSLSRIRGRIARRGKRDAEG